MIGRRGDYYTSVSVGTLFGELLAFQFAEWLQGIENSGGGSFGESPGRKPVEGREAMRIVEAGAHDGELARDILTWMREHRPGLFRQLEYCMVEPSEGRRKRQRRKLDEFGNKVRWVWELAELNDRAASDRGGPDLAGLRGIVFSNELLDSMPAHQLGWDAKAQVWFEWGVKLQDGRFVWTRMPDGGVGEGREWWRADFLISSFQLPPERRLQEILPDGFTTELCPAAEEWWRQAGMVLECGKLLTIDYGLTAEELFVPERPNGTTRGYHHHQLSGDLLACPGEQDITAHVNFTAIRAAGESAGLNTDADLTQAQFLTSVAARTWKDQGSFGKWTRERMRQFKTLTHPEHLGRSFRVLVQERHCPGN